MFGLSDGVLESIQNSPSSSSEEECYRGILLNHWIKTGHAYWSILVDILKSPLLGEKDAAEEISKTYLSKTILYLHNYTCNYV